jgi:hypothetical protein
MNIVIPYVEGGLDPRVEAFGKSHGARFENILDRIYGYYYFLKRTWAEGYTVLIIEQDILPTAGAIDEIWGCPQEWCAARYIPHEYTTEPAALLGCVKFSSALMKREPDVFTSLHLQEPAHYVTLDNRLIQMTLVPRGYRPHVHGTVRHLRVEKSKRFAA